MTEENVKEQSKTELVEPSGDVRMEVEIGGGGEITSEEVRPVSGIISKENSKGNVGDSVREQIGDGLSDKGLKNGNADGSVTEKTQYSVVTDGEFTDTMECDGDLGNGKAENGEQIVGAKEIEMLSIDKNVNDGDLGSTEVACGDNVVDMEENEKQTAKNRPRGDGEVGSGDQKIHAMDVQFEGNQVRESVKPEEKQTVNASVNSEEKVGDTSVVKPREEQTGVTLAKPVEDQIGDAMEKPKELQTSNVLMMSEGNKIGDTSIEPVENKMENASVKDELNQTRDASVYSKENQTGDVSVMSEGNKIGDVAVMPVENQIEEALLNSEKKLLGDKPATPVKSQMKDLESKENQIGEATVKPEETHFLSASSKFENNHFGNASIKKDIVDGECPVNTEGSNTSTVFYSQVAGGDDSGTEEEQAAFMKELENFYKEKSLEFKPPKFYGEGLNCLKLWRAVTKLGGYEQVTSCKLWRQVGESFKPPKTCTTISWSFRCFYEKALLEYEKHKITTGELQVPVSAPPEVVSVENQVGNTHVSGSGRARRDSAARAMQGWHSQRLLGNGEVSEPIIKDKSSISFLKRDKQHRSGSGIFKRKKPSTFDHSNKAARLDIDKTQMDTMVVDCGPAADWVKINVRRTRDCFEVYALVPGLLREEVHVQSDAAGRLVISGEPEQPDNPWGVTPFRKIVSLPSRIDAHQTSAIVTLHGQLFVRAPFEQQE